MIGNDIVCLATANESKRLNSQRFLDKIFTNEEQAIIKNAPNPNVAIWQLWSVKESAYKSWIQQGFNPVFSPKKIVCKRHKQNFIANIEMQIFEVAITTTDQYIYAETLDKNAKIISDCFHLNKSNYYAQSFHVKERLKKRVAMEFNLNFSEIDIKKSAKHIPVLTYKGENLPIKITLSHHGNFGAYAMAEV